MEYERDSSFCCCCLEGISAGAGGVEGCRVGGISDVSTGGGRIKDGRGNEEGGIGRGGGMGDSDIWERFCKGTGGWVVGYCVGGGGWG